MFTGGQAVTTNMIANYPGFDDQLVDLITHEMENHVEVWPEILYDEVVAWAGREN